MNTSSDLDTLVETMMQLGKLISQGIFQAGDHKQATLLQILALKHIYYHQNTTAGDLGLSLCLSKSSATQLIERLVQAGLVKKENDESDRRITHLTLSDEGIHEFEKIKKMRIEKAKKIFSKVPATDIKELIRIHTQLIESLRKDNEFKD